MKKISIALLFMGLFVTVSAQDTYDVMRLNTSDLNGTARYIGMGGALGALGADVSAMGTNPAGIGLFRRSDVSLSASLLNTGTDNDDKTYSRMGFDQIGGVVTYKYGNYSSLKYINFGFNYKKKKNFFDDFYLQMDWDGKFSQTYQMADLANDGSYALSDAAIKAEVIGKTPTDDYGGNGAYDTYYRQEQRGAISEFDFSLAANINDRVFLGLSLGMYDVSLSRFAYYTEYDAQDYSYDMVNSYYTDGSGVDFKLGAIFRPIEDSNFRFGLALHTPTFYRLTDSNSVDIVSYDENDKEIASGYADVSPVDYEITTPWKFNVSAGTTFGSSLAVGLEYEYEDFSTLRIKEPEGYSSNYTETINSYNESVLKGVHTLRAGFEFRPVADLAVRAGYNYSSSKIDGSAYRSLYMADVMTDTLTDTAYHNEFSTNRFTLGLGYKISDFYIDAAYQYSVVKRDFFAFDDTYTENGTTVVLPATYNDQTRQQFTLTLGYRF